MTKYKLVNSATEKHTWITSWLKLKSLELRVFALEKRERLSANMVAHQSDVHLRIPKLQLLIDLRSHRVES